MAISAFMYCRNGKAGESNHKRVYRLYKEEGLELRSKTNRECLAIYVDKSIKGETVVKVLDKLFVETGLPKKIKIDNGPEFNLGLRGMGLL